VALNLLFVEDHERMELRPLRDHREELALLERIERDAPNFLVREVIRLRRLNDRRDEVSDVREDRVGDRLVSLLLGFYRGRDRFLLVLLLRRFEELRVLFGDPPVLGLLRREARADDDVDGSDDPLLLVAAKPVERAR
jgi:hypothetical protein